MKSNPVSMPPDRHDGIFSPVYRLVHETQLVQWFRPPVKTVMMSLARPTRNAAFQPDHVCTAVLRVFFRGS
jgi:hypothetical protein